MAAAGGGAAEIDPSSLALHDDPLGFFAAEHCRQRQLFDCIERLAAAETLDCRLADEVVAFLSHDMKLHRLDEEEDLFPLLRRKCPPEDAIGDVLAALSAAHAIADRLAEPMIAGIEAAVAAGRLGAARPRLRAAMTGYVRSERRRLALENAIVLPLARRRLRTRDLAALSARMAQRRLRTFPAPPKVTS